MTNHLPDPTSGVGVSEASSVCYICSNTDTDKKKEDPADMSMCLPRLEFSSVCDL